MKVKIGDWYAENIEEGVRDVVNFLRNHGYNTSCSCHHEMYIQIEAFPGIDLQNLHNILFCYFLEIKESVTYKIEYHHEVENQYTTTCWIELKLNRPKREKE